MANYVTAQKIVLNRNIFGANLTNRDNTITSIDLSNTEFKDGDAGEAFAFLTNLTSVTNFPQGVTNMYATFVGCAYITDVPSIPNSVVDLTSTYNGCYRLTNAPEIPNSVVNMNQTFASCTLKLTTPPTIPNSVTNMHGTFGFCNNLLRTPIIPNGVVNMVNTFFRCENLVTALNIPSSVTNMYETFLGCYNLTGNIYIESNQISSATNCFDFVVKPTNVYIPFTYENGVNTQTYNAFTAAGYDTNGSTFICNVYLKDINNITDPTYHAYTFKKGTATYNASTNKWTVLGGDLRDGFAYTTDPNPTIGTAFFTSGSTDVEYLVYTDGNNFYITSNGTPELEGQRMYWCQRDSSNDISKLDDGYFILLRR